MNKLIILEECPKCSKKLHPPLKSSARQVCTGCGWSSRPGKPKANELAEVPDESDLKKEWSELFSAKSDKGEQFLESAPIDHDKLDSKDKFYSEKQRKAYQFIQVRVQLLGRGMTNEIMNIYVNGKRLHPKQKTLHEFLNYLGWYGFSVVTAELETEGTYTHFFTLQREVYTREYPSKDILDMLNQAREGVDFGDAVRNFLEFSLGDNW